MLSDSRTDIAKTLLEGNMALNEKFSSALLLAVSKQDTNIISMLLENGADVNLDNHAWFTRALKKAVMDGRPANSELLVEYGDAIHMASPTALCEAISLGNERVVHQLLEAKADANFDNGLPLRVACSKGLEKVVALLLTAGALQILNEHDWFHKLVNTQQYRHARDLLLSLRNASRGVNRPFKLRQTPLLEAVTGGHTATTSLLLGQKPAYETELDEALWHASKLGNFELVQQLVTKGADVNGDLPVMQDIGTCLAAASGNGHEEVVEFLLKNGAECNTYLLHQKKAITPLESACAHGHVSTAKLLLGSGANPDFHSWSGPAAALSAAVNGGNRDLIELLIERGADVNYHQTNRDGPLECAANNGDLEVFKLLLKKGARITTRADVHRTTIQAVGYGGNEQIIQFVLDSRVDIDSFGTAFDVERVGTALQSAALNGHCAAVRLLCENGADIHSVRRGDKHARNALGFAASGGSAQVLQYLLENGSQHTVDGGPLYYAAAFGNIEIIQYLLQNKPEHSSSSHVMASLEVAVKEGQWHIISTLLSTTERTFVSNTIIQRLMVSNNEALVWLMIEEGARMTMVLEHAIIARKHRIYRDLLERYVNVTFGNNLPVRIAAWNGDVDLVNTLIRRGADINDNGFMMLPSCDGMDYNATALHWASSSQNPHMVQLLLEHGADIASESTFRAAVQAAMGDQKIIDSLLKKRFELQNTPTGPLKFSRRRPVYVAVRSSPRNTPTEGENLVQGIEPPLVERYREHMSRVSRDSSYRNQRHYNPAGSEIEEESDNDHSQWGEPSVHSKVQFQPSESDSETIPEKGKSKHVSRDISPCQSWPK